VGEQSSETELKGHFAEISVVFDLWRKGCAVAQIRKDWRPILRRFNIPL
jgi:hypothetical protein